MQTQQEQREAEADVKVISLTGIWSKYWPNWDFDLMMALEEKSADHQNGYSPS